jgi:hypothetical protein
MKRRDFVKTVSAAGAGLLLRSPLSLQAQKSQPDPAVKRVFVMFKCHFDAGFIDTQYNVVHKRYFEKFFPQAIEIARDANAAGKRRYVWTTGSWLLYEYLEQASPADRKTMEQAIARRDIAWHALPFTWQTEMLSQSMIEGSLALSQSLDRRFGVVTTGAKMTDVPGHTRGIIPPLAKHGVNLLEIGVNGATTTAKVPPIFLWKDPSGASLPVMYHLDYGAVARVPGSDLVLATRVRNDNEGPHTPEEIAAMHAELAAQFPNAEITACNLSDMANALQPYRANLPVVTQEIGDTWIYGCASDPRKVARYREVSRLRDAWIAQGKFQIGDATDLALLRSLLLEVEHTWGTDTKTWIDFDNYKPADLARMLDTKGYKVMEFSWEEKRKDLYDAVASLPADLRDQALTAVQDLTPHWYDLNPSPQAVVQPAGKPIETAHFILGLDAQTGAITRLQNKSTGHEWASKTNPIALFTYQTLSQEDYQRFLKAYVLLNDSTIQWAPMDYGKPNIEKYGAVHQDWHPSKAEVYVEETADAHRIVARLEIQDEEAFQSGRASYPRKIFLELLLPKAEPVIHLTLSCFQKPATRFPEALWLTFNPIAEDQKGWTLDKSGEQISPFDVVASGNRHMHSLSKGFEYRQAGHRFAVETIDAPVVALGERTPLLFSNTQPDLSAGIHSSLFNNAWGTNYIMWYAEDMRFRFKLRA